MSGELRVAMSAEGWATARVALAEAALIVDALLGTGLRGAVKGLLSTTIEDLNAATGGSNVSAVNRELCQWTPPRVWLRMDRTLAGRSCSAIARFHSPCPRWGNWFLRDAIMLEGFF